MKVVIVEVDGGVLARRVPPAHLTSGPARSGDRARWEVHQTAAEPMGSDVDDVESLDAAGEIPARHESGQRQQGIEHERFRRGDGSLEPQRILDLAVHMLTRIRSQTCADQQRRRRIEPCPGRKRRGNLFAPRAGQRGVADTQRARGRVDDHPDAMPPPQRESDDRWRAPRARPPAIPTRAVTPAGPVDRAHPAPTASCQREITHWSPAARVGQTRADTVNGPLRRNVAAASTRA